MARYLHSPQMPLISFTDSGLFCEAGGFYIDPWLPVERAVITHAHSDHARPGSNYYLCHHQTKPLLELRLGPQNYQGIEWGDTIDTNGVKLSLHPAGHIIGSSQIRVEYKGETWVVSGDYKTSPDGISGDFEPLSCNTFITESTFGLPIYQWESQEKIYQSIRDWTIRNRSDGFNSVLLAYSLGKSQRVISCLAEITDNIYAHGAIANTQEALLNAGWNLPAVKRITTETSRSDLKETIIIAPPGADGSPWIKRFSPFRLGICSGWMQVRGNVRRRNADAGFALSDHADWKGLLSAVAATGASTVFVTHGFQSAFSRYLNEQGIRSFEVSTAYGTEDEGDVKEDEIKPTEV
jgi:putative mRNA 3-end processing factor